MQRTVNRSSVQNNMRGPGLFRATSQLQPSLAVSPLELCFVVLVNKTREGITIRAESRTPMGPSFLDSMMTDLEVGGLGVVSCCVANDLHIDCSNGVHKLCIQNGEMRLLPGSGFRQKMTTAGLIFPVKYVLHVEIEEVLESKDHIYSSIRDILASNENCTSVKAISSVIETLPKQCTLLIPRTLPRILASLGSEDLLKHITIPVALFFQQSLGGVETALDGSSVVIRILPNEKVSFEIEASVNAPAVKLQSSVEPLRSKERFQVIYLCD
jgi:hypothetical protein